MQILSKESPCWIHTIFFPCTTNSEFEAAFTRRENSTGFFIFYSWEIKLPISIVKFIKSISIKKHTIKIYSVNFTPFIQNTVMLPKWYPIR